MKRNIGYGLILETIRVGLVFTMFMCFNEYLDTNNWLWVLVASVLLVWSCNIGVNSGMKAIIR